MSSRLRVPGIEAGGALAPPVALASTRPGQLNDVVGEFQRLDLCSEIACHLEDGVADVGILLGEGRPVVAQSERVIDDQHLPVAVGAGTNTYGGNDLDEGKGVYI